MTEELSGDYYKLRNEILLRKYRSVIFVSLGGKSIAKPMDTKALARKKVELKIRSGDWKRPNFCSRCGSDKSKIEAHHEDYSRPLDVIWICKKCHCIEHAKKS